MDPQETMPGGQDSRPSLKDEDFWVLIRRAGKLLKLRQGWFEAGIEEDRGRFNEYDQGNCRR